MKIISRIQELNQTEKKTLLEIALKTSEECGELAQAVLSSNGSSGAAYKGLGLDDVQEESVDVIVCAMSAFFKAGGDLQKLEDLLTSKVEKWAAKQSK